MPEPEIKGVGVGSWNEALRTMVGDDAWRGFVAGLPADLRQYVEKPPLPMSWVPAWPLIKITELSVPRILGGDLGKVVELGRRQMHDDLKGVYRLFVRVASPRYVAGRAGQIYQTYTRHNGVMRVVADGPTWLEIAIDDVVTAAPVFWAGRQGNVQAVIEATGVRNVRTEITDGGGTGPKTRYRVTWT